MNTAITKLPQENPAAKKNLGGRNDIKRLPVHHQSMLVLL